MRPNQRWIKTGKMVSITPFILEDLTQEQAVKDGFLTLNDGSPFFDPRLECIWGLLEINHLLPKKHVSKELLEIRLKLIAVIYEWEPLDEPFNPKDRLKTLTFTKFIPQIREGIKKTTIRFSLKKIIPNEKVWLCMQLLEDGLHPMKVQTLFNFFPGERAVKLNEKAFIKEQMKTRHNYYIRRHKDFCEKCSHFEPYSQVQGLCLNEKSKNFNMIMKIIDWCEKFEPGLELVEEKENG